MSNPAWPRVVPLAALALAACGDNIGGPPPATQIAGQLWSDDGDGALGGGEAPLVGFEVYLDLDEDGTLDAGEPTTTTDATGGFVLEPAAPGTFVVRQVLPFGWRSTLSLAAARTDTGPAHIIGGTITADGEYPFMVAVGQLFNGQTFQYCGGVLVSDRHVVTAAHCSEGQDPADAGVLVGTRDIFAGGESLAVASIAIHPRFEDTPSGSDIAVWTLAERIDLAASGLATVEMLDAATEALAAPAILASTLGWGTGNAGSELEVVHLPIVDETTCAAVYPEATNFETQICAGVAAGGVDSCYGDSGGPLLVRDPARGVWMHAGITSWGDGCALPDTPGVYARVSALSGWVKGEAAEAAGAIRVTVLDGETAAADFPTLATTRAMEGEIDPRWQLTGLDLAGQVAVATPVEASWHVIGEPGVDGSALTCSLDADGRGPMPAQVATCGLGDNMVVLPGFTTGIYASELTVALAGKEMVRTRVIFAGTPPSTAQPGALTAQDPVDPDYGDTYYVDYYDVGALAGDRAFALDLTTTAFDPFLTLYDADARDPVTGGGILAYGDFIGPNTIRLVVVPEPGVTYLVGVSTYWPEDTGAYQLTIINDGVLTAQ
jgi:hypothetical protein